MSAFHHQLRRIRFLLRGSRLFVALLALTALVTLLWLLFGLADASAAFESSVRVSITGVLVMLSGMASVVVLVRSLRVPPNHAAMLADAALADPRRPASAALSLDSTAAHTPLAKMLSARTLDAAAAVLAGLPAKKIVPWHGIRIAVIALTIVLALVGGLRLATPKAFSVILARLMHPASDVAPYSPLVFTIDPAQPATVYGGEILVAAEITGARLTKPVELLIRHPRTRETLRLPAFRESPTRFSRKLDGLTEPIEIAFASGKARSKWHPVEILLEPNILNGLVRIVPPEYTGLPASEFPLDTNEISAIEGSRVTLELTSNRPLGSGALVFTPAAAPGTEAVSESISATIPSVQTAAFTWTATRSGRISATLRDLRGTRSPRPLELSFRTLLDQPPSVVLSSPPPLILATPKSVIPVHGNARDDFALSKIHFVRTLSGFRDRVRVVAPALRDKSYDFSDKLDLDELGLEAGQTIELMLDASDHNPTLLGQGSSEISRIQIISEDQYSAYIRAKTTIDEFANRFQAARDAINQARKTLEELDDAAEKQIKDPNPDALAEAVKKAAQAQKTAAELLEKIADDFSAFDLEDRLKDLAAELADDLRANAMALESVVPGTHPEQLRKEIDEMLERLGQRNDRLAELDDDVAKVNHAATLLEMAAKFRQIYESQASLAKRFGTIVEELRLGQDQNRRLLPLLADTQEKNREALDAFKVELRRRAEALPIDDPDLLPMIDSALGFLEKLAEAEPETMMDSAAKHGKAGEAMDAFTNAERARATLERLMSEPGPFPEAAKGKAPQFDIQRPDVNKTLQQLLEGLLGQNPGQGNGNQPGGMGRGPAGMGFSGAPGSGFPMNLPVIGPERLRFSDLSAAGGGRDGKGKSSMVQPLPDTAELGTLKPTETREGQPSGVSPESIPEPYREAVKRFLTP